jgi:hypothetical protein
MTCDRCLHDTATGEHGIGLCPLEPRRIWGAVKPDTILGGFLAENAWREPRYFDSQKKYEKALDADGLMLKPKKTHGAYPVSAETLAWAAKRVAARTKSVEIDVQTLDETMTVQAEL